MQLLIARVTKLEATVEAYGRILDGMSVVMSEVAEAFDAYGTMARKEAET